jgi:hypothetical protein
MKSTLNLTTVETVVYTMKPTLNLTTVETGV